MSNHTASDYPTDDKIIITIVTLTIFAGALSMFIWWKLYDETLDPDRLRDAMLGKPAVELNPRRRCDETTPLMTPLTP